MKKIKHIIALGLSLLATTNLSSCIGNNKGIVMKFDYDSFVDEKNTDIEVIYTVDYESSTSLYQNLLDTKQDFVIFIESTECSSCKSFQPIKQEVLNSLSFVNYTIDVTIFKNIKDFNYSKQFYTPAMAFYNDGELVTLLDAYKYEKVFSSKQELEKTLKANIDIKDIYYQNEATLVETKSTLNGKKINHFKFTNDVTNINSSIYKFRENEKDGFLILSSFTDLTSKGLFEGDILAAYLGYSNYSFRFGNFDYLLKDVNNEKHGTVKIILKDETTKDFVYPQYTNVNEDGETVQKAVYYPLIMFYSYDSETKSYHYYTGELIKSYEDMIRFINRNIN